MNYRFAAVAAVLLALVPMARPAAAQSSVNPVPTPTPTVEIPPALPPLIKHEAYVSAGYLVPPIVRNEFSAGFPGYRYRSGVLRAAIEFPLAAGLTGMVKVDARRYVYPHYGSQGPVLACAPGSTNLSCVQAVGPNGTGATSVPGFAAREYEYDVRVGVRALEPRIYLGVSYLQRANNYGYPRLRGYGFGLEKLPDVDQILSLYGGAYYYPMVRGNYVVSAGPMTGTTYDLAYHVVRYDVGLTLKPSLKSPLFVDAGYLGDRSKNANNAPATISHSGPFVGVGLTF